jgi:hypothetical protein
MKSRLLLVPTLLSLAAPFASPAQAAPACVGVNWRNGDWCTFEAPTRAFVFGGVATAAEDGDERPWVAVQVTFQGQVIASCYDEGNGTEPAVCRGNAQAFAPTFTHRCTVYGSGGPKYHCADPPMVLPLP